MKTIFLCSLLLLIVSCSTFNGKRSNDYQTSNSLAITEIPEGLESSKLGVKHSIPNSDIDILNEQDAIATVPRPLNTFSQKSNNFVKIQKLGSQSWILASLQVGAIWPRVNYFIQRLNIPTINIDSAAGIIETDLVQFTADSLYYQFKLVVDQGVQLNTTEITIYERSFVAVPNNLPTQWSGVSTNPEREEWMREALANELALTINDQTASLVGEVVGRKSRVSIETTAQQPYILLQLNSERAFGSIAYALQREGFTIEKQSRSEGAFSVIYRNPKNKKKSNFFTRLFKRKSKPVNYQIQLTVTTDNTEVRIFDNNNAPLKRDKAIELLTIIRNNLT